MSRTLSFQAFDEWGELRIYDNGFLLHWRQTGCTYFVTFRLADSVPEGVLAEWNSERQRWLSARGINPEVDGWVGKFRSLPFEERKLFERRCISRLFQALDKAHGACVQRDSRRAILINKFVLRREAATAFCRDRFAVVPWGLALKSTFFPHDYACTRLLSPLRG